MNNFLNEKQIKYIEEKNGWRFNEKGTNERQISFQIEGEGFFSWRFILSKKGDFKELGSTKSINLKHIKVVMEALEMEKK